MTILLKCIKGILTGLVVLAIAWAFFDFGRRYVQHRRDLAERPVELTVMHWGDPAEDKIVADLCAKFTELNKDVRIVRINPGSDAYANKLKTMMAANNAPDVFYLRPDMLPELADNDLIAPLDEYFDKEPEALRQDFFPILLKAFRYDTATGLVAGANGRLYGLPKDFTTACFFINIDLFEKAGIDWRDIQKNGWDWPRFEAEAKKIRALNGTPGLEGREIYGTMFDLWPDTLRNFLWTYEGDFFTKNPDGTPNFAKLALHEPGAQQGLELIRRMRLVDKTAYNATGLAKNGGQEFKNGNIGSIGPLGQWLVTQYRAVTGFKWDMVPVPSGTVKASQTFFNGWTMSTQTKNRARTYELISFLCGREGQVQQARSGLSIPALQSVARSDDFLRAPGAPLKNEQVFLDAIEYAKLPLLPKQPEFDVLMRTLPDRAISAGRVSTMELAHIIQDYWSRELNSPLRTGQWSAMPWKTIVAGLAAVVAVAVAVLVIRARREPLGPIDRATERSGFRFIAPWLIGFAVFTLGPMIVSLLLAFSQWSGMVPLSQAKFVGLTNFKQLFTYDPLFFQSIKVTAYFVIL
ncbi:MAG TPA: extracellular solute-binding protein, partial [Tepidisphaeraceae bacterium]